MKLFARNLLVCGAFALLPLTVNSADSTAGVAESVAAYQQQLEIDTPDFSAIKNAEDRKRAFVAYLLPSYQAVATDILSQRSQLEKLKTQLADGIDLSHSQEGWLSDLAEQYDVSKGIEFSETIDKLLVRVDILPPELVLSQAATESGWGTSRLARKRNNYFGHFCASCNKIPYRSGTNHATSFDSAEFAVRAYMQNLNTHPAYQKVRDIRATMRANEKPMDAVALAKGLRSYSTMGDGYVRKIQGMIRTNKAYWPENSAKD